MYPNMQIQSDENFILNLEILEKEIGILLA